MEVALLSLFRARVSRTEQFRAHSLGARLGPPYSLPRPARTACRAGGQLGKAVILLPWLFWPLDLVCAVMFPALARVAGASHCKAGASYELLEFCESTQGFQKPVIKEYGN